MFSSLQTEEVRTLSPKSVSGKMVKERSPAGGGIPVLVGLQHYRST